MSSPTRRTLYPPIEPYDSGMLDVGDGQQLYWEVSGNPDGKPAVFVHGGPGGGTNPAQRRFFDPQAYRIVLFDQRGCGRSTPSVADGADLSVNTTSALVADLERLREHLGIDRWLVFGGSWGSTLSLAYAQAHPQRATELVLRGIFLLRDSEIDWFYRGGAAELYPDAWEGYLAPIAEGLRADPSADPVELYHRLLHSPDDAVAEQAAVAWSVWEGSTSQLLPDPQHVSDSEEPRFALAFARIENHYFVNHGFLEPDQLLRDAGRLAEIPGVIVQGRYDVVCPATSAWALHRAWPSARLELVPDAGHASTEPGNVDALVRATDGFRP